MSKVKKSSPSLINQTNVIILAGLLVAALGYFGYRSLLTKPDINVIGAGEGGTVYTPKKTIFIMEMKNGVPNISRLDVPAGAIVSTINPYPTTQPKSTSTKQTQEQKREEDANNKKEDIGSDRGANTGKTGRYDTK